MNIKLNASISLDNVEIIEFIYNDAMSEMLIPPITYNGFSNELADRRANVGIGFEHTTRIPCFVEEQWSVIQNGSIAGINNVTVVLGHDVKITTESWLFLQNGLSESSKQRARTLLTSYDVNLHGEDLIAWINSQLDSSLTKDMFILDTAVKISKLYTTPSSKQKIEIDVSQRKLLQALYNAGSGTYVKSTIHLLPDASYSKWAAESNLSVNKLGERLITGKIEPKLVGNEVPINTSDAHIEKAIDDLLAIIIPSQCGSMKRNQFKLLTLFEYPEFRLSWTHLRIKLGCVYLELRIPIIQVRLSKLVLYVYYSLPANVGQTALLVAETCAKRSALGATVIGIVLWNHVAAIASFESLFKRCLEREVINCIHPGIMIMKETGNWVP